MTKSNDIKHHHAFRTVALLLVASMFSGCSANGPLARPHAATVGNASEIERSFAELTCVIPKRSKIAESNSPEVDGAENVAAPLVGALAGFAIDAVIGVIGEALKAEQKRRNAVWSALGISETCDFSKLKPQHSAFGELKIAREVALPDANYANKRAANKEHNRLGWPGFDLTAKVEYRVIDTDPEGDSIEVSIQPETLTYGRTAALSRNGGKKTVGILLSLSPKPILGLKSADEDTQVEGGVLLKLGTLQDGLKYKSSLLNKVHGASIFKIKPGQKMNITAIVTETEGEDLILKAIGGAFESNKDGLSKALKDAVGGDS